MSAEESTPLQQHAARCALVGQDLRAKGILGHDNNVDAFAQVYDFTDDSSIHPTNWVWYCTTKGYYIVDDSKRQIILYDNADPNWTMRMFSNADSTQTGLMMFRSGEITFQAIFVEAGLDDWFRSAIFMQHRLRAG